MSMPPCIRGIKQFSKGCPQKEWNGQDGCPAWKELTVTVRGEPLKKQIKKQCIDLWLHDFQYEALGLLLGNQQATESFRNNMTTEEGPKPDPAVLGLMQLIQDNTQHKIEY